MQTKEKTTQLFLEELSSKAPAPGGGGASALVGALTAALGMMVCHLTIGKKKYALYEEDLIASVKQLQELRKKLLDLVDADAQAFLPLSRAYGLPKEEPDRERIMEEALNTACSVPLEIMETVLLCDKELGVLLEKGSRLALSDVGVAALFAQAAIEGASLNVFINTKLMKDQKCAQLLNEKAEHMISEGTQYKNWIYETTLQSLK